MANPHFVITDTFYRDDNSVLLPEPIVIKYVIEQFASVNPKLRTVVRYLDAIIGGTEWRGYYNIYGERLCMEVVGKPSGIGTDVRYPTKGSLNVSDSRYPLGIIGRTTSACQFLGYMLTAPAYEVLQYIDEPAHSTLKAMLLASNPDANKGIAL